MGYVSSAVLALWQAGRGALGIPIRLGIGRSGICSPCSEAYVIAFLDPFSDTLSTHFGE